MSSHSDLESSQKETFSSIFLEKVSPEVDFCARTNPGEPPGCKTWPGTVESRTKPNGQGAILT
jgi:hypothetical protein